MFQPKIFKLERDFSLVNYCKLPNLTASQLLILKQIQLLVTSRLHIIDLWPLIHQIYSYDLHSEISSQTQPSPQISVGEIPPVGDSGDARPLSKYEWLPEIAKASTLTPTPQLGHGAQGANFYQRTQRSCNKNHHIPCARLTLQKKPWRMS